MRYLEMILSGIMLLVFWKTVEFHIHNNGVITTGILAGFTLFFWICICIALGESREELIKKRGGRK